MRIIECLDRLQFDNERPPQPRGQHYNRGDHPFMCNGDTVLLHNVQPNSCINAFM